MADVAPTINAHFGEKQGLEDQHIRGGAGLFVGVSHTLTGEGHDASEDGSGRGTPIVAQAVSLRGRYGGNTPEVERDGVSPALRSSQGGSDKQHVLTSTIRRITPREAERLMGFPDDYTLVPHRGKPMANGPRYRLLGNSMAVNVMRWLGERISMVDTIARPEG